MNWLEKGEESRGKERREDEEGKEGGRKERGREGDHREISYFPSQRAFNSLFQGWIYMTTFVNKFTFVN